MATIGSAPDTRRHLLLERLDQARSRTDELFRMIRSEALYDRPIRERHRIVFYIGHLEAFDWNLIPRGALGIEPFHPDYDKLFAFGIDPVDGGLPTDQPSDWPPMEEVLAYNRRVRSIVDESIRDPRRGGAERPALEDGTLVHVAIEHRLMHAETLAYMFHQLPFDRKIPAHDPPHTAARAVAPRKIGIPAGVATLGLDRAEGFGWDNERDPLRVAVPAFRIDSHNVTNGRFLEFLRAGGYEERSLWSAEDWEWKTREGIRHPGFWIPKDNGEWGYRGMFAEVPLPLDRPAYVSQAEASAFARASGATLPTEAQFHRAAYGTPEGGERSYPWGDDGPEARHGNFDFHRWEPSPVGAHPEGDSAFGVSDLVGNGWEWTSTKFGPLPGFEAFPFYAGYSANFFDGKHFVMKGGSSRTAACLLRRSFRNWFQAHYPYVYAGFRCVETPPC